MDESSYTVQLTKLAKELEDEADYLEIQADEDEAYANGSWLMGGSMASSHRGDTRRVDDLRKWAHAKRATARDYRTKASRQRPA